MAYSPDFRHGEYVKKNDELWVVGANIVIELGYEKPEKALEMYVDAKNKAIAMVKDINMDNKSNVVIVNQNGCIELLLKSAVIIGTQEFFKVCI